MLSIQSLQMTTRIRTAAQRAGTLGVFALASALAFVPAAQAELQPMNVRIAADLTGPPHPAEGDPRLQGPALLRWRALSNSRGRRGDDGR
jgi:hypothetical protein